MLLESLTAIHDWAPVAALRGGRWSYAAVNTAHIAGFALLLGAIVPLDLRLMGWWRDIPIAILSRVLLPVAMTGLALAVTAGFFLFAVRAPEYAGKLLFWVKMVLVAGGIANALLLRRAAAWEAQRAAAAVAPPTRLRIAGGVSILLWLSVIVCGRMLAFVD